MRALLKKGGGPYANFTHSDTNNFFAREAPKRFCNLVKNLPDPYTKGIGTGGSNVAVLLVLSRCRRRVCFLGTLISR